MDCGPPGSSVHGISQARILEWVAISFSTVVFYLNEVLKQLLWLIRQIVHIHYLGTVTEKLSCFSVNILVLWCLCPLKSQVAVFAFNEAVTPSCLYRLTWGGKYTVTLIGILRLFQTFFKDTPVPCTQFLLGENSEARMLLSMQQRQSLCRQFSGCFPGAMPNAHICVLSHRPTRTGWLLDVPQAICKCLFATVGAYTGSWPWGGGCGWDEAPRGEQDHKHGVCNGLGLPAGVSTWSVEPMSFEEF